MEAAAPIENKPKKFVSVDTCIFIGCCLLESEGTTEIRTALETLLSKLEADEATLLLPEVVVLEFPKVLAVSLEALTEEVCLHKKQLQSNMPAKGKSKLKPAMMSRLHEKMDEFVDDTRANTEVARDLIDRIFKHANTVVIPISPDLIARAYKISLAGKKPSKKERNALEADCVIIASLSDYLKAEEEYELFFCSVNTSDFANTTVTSGPEIHEDIKSEFKHIVYYTNLLKLLNDEFGTTYPSALIEKLEEESNTKGTATLVINIDTLGATGSAESSEESEVITGPESAVEII